jgi:hypothetical protein
MMVFLECIVGDGGLSGWWRLYLGGEVFESSDRGRGDSDGDPPGVYCWRRQRLYCGKVFESTDSSRREGESGGVLLATAEVVLQ